MSAPVTAEELAEIARIDVAHCTGISAGWCPTHGDCTCPRNDTDTREEQADDCPLHGTASNHGDDKDEPPQVARSLVLRLARDLTAERAEIQVMADMLDEAGIGHRDGDTVRSRLARMIADANTEAERTEKAEADRDALAAKIETMLSNEEDARALRLAEHASREDVAGKLEALRAAVRAHEAAAKGDPSRLIIAAERMWAAAKA